MKRVTPVSNTGQGIRRDWPQILLSPFAWFLRTGDQAATIDRLFGSQHVKDPRLVVVTASIAVGVIALVGIAVSVESAAQSQQIYFLIFAAPKARGISWHLLSVAARNFLPFFVPMLGVLGAVLTWAYQAGSARLGVVDLFACEISTLCRVASVVDTVHLQIEKFKKGPAVERADGDNPHFTARQFTSAERYFPVFEGNTRDLENLEARVVINITAFYTYMKVFRDSLRAVAEFKPLPAEPCQDGPWHGAVRNIVYVLFLGMESGRKAINDLVEFEPEKAERTIVILLSELEAYEFLRTQFDPEDRRYKRIMMREPDYRYEVPRLYRSVDSSEKQEREAILARTKSNAPWKPPQWKPAWLLLPDLKARYEDAIGRSIMDVRDSLD